MQKPELIQKQEVIPKLRKIEKKVEEPKKEEPKRTKVKVVKAKKYEELPEIPDYERPVLEKYEESAFEASGPGERTKVTPLQKPESGVKSKIEKDEPAKNGLPKVSVWFFSSVISIQPHTFPCGNIQNGEFLCL